MPELAARFHAVTQPAKVFISRSDAKPIPAHEVRNFERLSDDEETTLFKSLECESTWGETWLPSDSRWTLTPAQMRKLERKRLAKLAK
jgi:hypothetical protein